MSSIIETRQSFGGIFFGDIILCISQEAGADKLLQQWKDLAILLGTESQILRNVWARSSEPTCTLQHILEILLLEWQSRLESKATLRQLITAINQVVPEIGVGLETKFASKIDFPMTVTQRPLTLRFSGPFNSETETLLLPKTPESLTPGCHPLHVVYKPCSTKQLFLAVIVGGVFVAVLVLVGGMILNKFILHDAAYPPESSPLVSPSIDFVGLQETNPPLTATRRHTGPLKLAKLQHHHDEKITHSISSPKSFNAILAIPSADHTYAFHVNVNDLNDWSGQPLLKTDKVKHLKVSGKINSSIIQQLVKALPHVKSLHVHLQSTQNCVKETKADHKPITSSRIRKLKIENVWSCDEIYTILTNGLYMTGLKEAEIESSKLEHEVLPQFYELVKRARHSIEKIVLKDCKLDPQFFDKWPAPHYSLRELIIAFHDRAQQEKIALGSSFKNVYPKVENFIVRNGEISVNELTAVMQLSSLKYLEMAVKVPADTSFDMKILDRAPATLVEANLMIQFENSKNCSFIEGNKNRKGLFKITTNCDR